MGPQRIPDDLLVLTKDGTTSVVPEPTHHRRVVHHIGEQHGTERRVLRGRPRRLTDGSVAQEVLDGLAECRVRDVRPPGDLDEGGSRDASGGLDRLVVVHWPAFGGEHDHRRA